MNTHENVDHPAHYNQSKIECIDAIDAATVGLSGSEAFYIGVTIKYLWRWKSKNGIEDIKKAIWYLNRMVEQYNENQD